MAVMAKLFRMMNIARLYLLWQYNGSNSGASASVSEVQQLLTKFPRFRFSILSLSEYTKNKIMGDSLLLCTRRDPLEVYILE